MVLADAFCWIKLSFKTGGFKVGDWFDQKQNANPAKSYQLLRRLTLIMMLCMSLTSCKANAYKSSSDQTKTIPTGPFWRPIDLTKKGSKLEILFRVKKLDSYGFYLCFYVDRPEYQNRERESGEYGPVKFTFWDGIKSFSQGEPLPLTKEQSEYNDRLGELMFGHKHGHAFINGKLDESKKAYTPVKIQLFSEDGTKIPVFYFNEKTMEAEQVPDEGIEPKLYAGGQSHDKIIAATGLKPAIYKVVIETLKDTPELKGIRTEFGFHTNIRRK